MKVVLDLDDELYRLVEYIPENMLGGILLDLIKDSIKSMRSLSVASTASIEQSTAAIEELKNLIQEAIAAAPAVQQTQNSDKEVKQEPVKAKPIVISSEFVPDDLDTDLLDMLK